MSRTRILAMFLPVLALGFCTGCPVPQERGQGKYQYITEPTKKGGYHLYLPVDYVKNDGRHPQGGDKKWPLVMTFHGMKPYDNALPQEREWEREADTYGYIVCAPKLETCDSFMEYPLTKEHDYVLRDRERVMAIMDHVFATTKADPRAVLSTSWSCGGYLAHYFVNRYPDRFSCIATRLSNFAPQMLQEANVSKYRNMPVAIFIGDGDFPACKSESEAAVAWYSAHGFSTVRGKMIDNIGHRRIPQTAAAFFAEQLNLQPLHADAAARTVATLQMVDYQPSVALASAMGAKVVITNNAEPPARVDTAKPGSAAASLPKPTPVANTPPPPKRQPEPVKPKPVEYASAAGAREPVPSRTTPPSANAAPNRTPPVTASNTTRVATAPPPKATQPPVEKRTSPRATPTERPPRDTRVADSTGRRSPPPPVPPIHGDGGERDTPAVRDTPPAPRRGTDTAVADASRPRTAPSNNATPAPKSRGPKRANIILNGPVGPAPHFMTYSVDLPAKALADADFLWMDNGVWLGDEPNGSKVLDSPGLHRITVLVITRGNEEYRGAAVVSVLDRAEGRAAAGDASD